MRDEPETTVGSAEEKPVKTRAFLSYSRKDALFTRRLAEALSLRGYAPDFDQSATDPANIDTGISAEDEWWLRLQELITAADVMVFIVSPDSAASKVCDEEIAYARNVGKRIIPIECRPIDFASAPPRLKALNVKIKFTGEAEEAFSAALNELCAALDVDVAWHRESRRLVELALKWEAEGRIADRVMSPADIRASERLLARRPGNVDPPLQVLTDFLETSRARLEEEMRRLRRTTGRAFVKPAIEALKERRHEHALRLAAAGALLANDLGTDLVPELWGPAAQAIFHGKTERVLADHDHAVLVAAFSPDNRTILTGCFDGSIRWWAPKNGLQLACVRQHKRAVRSISFSPDGQDFVTAAEDATARVFDAESGEEMIVLEGHGHIVTAASFSSNGRRIITSSSDKSVRIWDAKTAKQIARLNAPASVRKAVFAPNDERLLAAWESTACLWDASQRSVIAQLIHEGELTDVSFSPDGRRIVTASGNKTARVWDAETGTAIALLKGHDGPVVGACFSPDGRRILTASDDTTARLWDAASGAQIALLRGHSHFLTKAAFSPDGNCILTASADSTAYLWDSSNGREISAFKAHTSAIWNAAFSPDGRQVITAGQDGTARIWRTDRGSDIAVLTDGGATVDDLSFSSDGKSIWTASDGLRVWDAETGQLIKRLTNSRTTWVSFSPDERHVVTVSDKTASVLDSSTGAEIARLNGHDGYVKSASFSPDGRQIVTASADAIVRLWDAFSGSEIARFEGHAQYAYPGVNYASFSPDGRRILTASRDKTARLWDLTSDAEIGRLEGHEREVGVAVFSPDGRLIATASGDCTARLWDASTQRQVAVLKGHTISVSDVSFSADGRRLVTASPDTTLRIWDVATGQCIAHLRGHERPALCAAFNPEGNRLASGSLDGTTRVWDISRTAPLSRNRESALTAALVSGIGTRTADEESDLLLQDAPKDLLGEIFSRVIDPGQDDEGVDPHQDEEDPRMVALEQVLEEFRVPPHPNCYLSPTAFSETFGLHPRNPETSAVASTSPAIRSPILRWWRRCTSFGSGR